jgi:hypothetical protein
MTIKGTKILETGTNNTISRITEDLIYHGTDPLIMENLTEIEGSIHAPNTNTIILRKLKRIGNSLHAASVTQLEIDALKEIVTELQAPQLPRLHAPNLENGGCILNVGKANHIELPKLVKVHHMIYAESAEYFNIPNLRFGKNLMVSTQTHPIETKVQGNTGGIFGIELQAFLDQKREPERERTINKVLAAAEKIKAKQEETHAIIMAFFQDIRDLLVDNKDTRTSVAALLATNLKRHNPLGYSYTLKTKNKTLNFDIEKDGNIMLNGFPGNHVQTLLEDLIKTFATLKPERSKISEF